MLRLVRNNFDPDRCWILGGIGNRCLFAAMGSTIQALQLTAFERMLKWQIKDKVWD